MESSDVYVIYVLDFKQDKSKDDLTYILATDADVRFAPTDVMALMDLMSRNPRVGAVCGRTHPMGSGPMVWYQIFDYAIGHWLLKVANHVMGSVLCSPGCFSVYRARAIRDVLPQYATGVDCAMDFLIKDMGEDRWFCTLLVESGWKLEYCATSEDSTYCPEEFDEFFKQRRRWGPSTFANSVIVLQRHAEIRKNNDAISMPFIIYQVVLLISSIIGPATVLLVIAGGLSYAYEESISLVGALIAMVIMTTVFTIVCLFCSQNTQLKWAKFLTFVFAIIMAIVFVGMILQTVEDVGRYIDPPTVKPPTTETPGWHNGTVTTTKAPVVYDTYKWMFTPPTWYLFILLGIFFMTAMLHGFEGLSIIHGFWYLLCLPSGYLLLTIYSVANLTDRSWGTREGKTASAVETADMTWYEKLAGYFKYFCWCCVPPNLREKAPAAQQETRVVTEEGEGNGGEETDDDTSSEDLDETDGTEKLLVDIEEDGEEVDDANKPLLKKEKLKPKKSAMKKAGSLKRFPSIEMLDEKEKRLRSSSGSNSSFRFPGDHGHVRFSKSLPKLNAATTVDEWLPAEFKNYAPNFKQQGYDTVAFIAGNIKEKDLRDLGIENRGHRKRLMFFIDSLPPEDMFSDVPESVEEWLINLALEEYWPKFYESSYTEPRDLADIKYMTSENITTIFGISKEGHLKRIKAATSVLQYPTKSQTKIREARKAVMAEPVRQLKTDNADGGEEYEFWNELREICLLPEQAAFNQSGDLVNKLGDLRDTCLMVLTVANVLWLAFMITVMSQGDKLNVLGSDFAAVAFLFIYGFVLLMQFLSLLWHR
uniref:chitin synthase n=1 Tax=Clytia hemisphaerica TaxID=252671 RepID=A0A7M5WVI9_9CNID